MTEFIVGTVFFLIPLFLIIPLLGKYGDVKSAAAQTARYVAWERTVWYGSASSSNDWPGNSKSEANIREEARQRVVNFGGKITKEDKDASSFAEPNARGMWHNRDSSPMLANYNAANIGAIPNDDTPDPVTGTVLGAITAVTAITGFKLETKGLYTGSAAINISTSSIGGSLSGASEGVFDPGLLTFRDKNVILANAWSANGSSHVKTMTAGIAPLGLGGDSTVKEVFETLIKVAMAPFAPEILFLEIGKIEPDVVPPDRTTP